MPLNIRNCKYMKRLRLCFSVHNNFILFYYFSPYFECVLFSDNKFFMLINLYLKLFFVNFENWLCKCFITLFDRTDRVDKEIIYWVRIYWFWVFISGVFISVAWELYVRGVKGLLNGKFWLKTFGGVEIEENLLIFLPLTTQ